MKIASFFKPAIRKCRMNGRINAADCFQDIKRDCWTSGLPNPTVKLNGNYMTGCHTDITKRHDVRHKRKDTQGYMADMGLPKNRWKSDRASIFRLQNRLKPYLEKEHLACSVKGARDFHTDSV